MVSTKKIIGLIIGWLVSDAVISLIFAIIISTTDHTTMQITVNWVKFFFTTGLLLEGIVTLIGWMVIASQIASQK